MSTYILDWIDFIFLSTLDLFLLLTGSIRHRQVQRLADRVDLRLHLAVERHIHAPCLLAWARIPQIRLEWTRLGKIRRNWTELGKIRLDKYYTIVPQPTVLRQRPSQEQLEEPLPENSRQSSLMPDMSWRKACMGPTPASRAGSWDPRMSASQAVATVASSLSRPRTPCWKINTVLFLGNPPNIF